MEHDAPAEGSSGPSQPVTARFRASATDLASRASAGAGPDAAAPLHTLLSTRRHDDGAGVGLIEADDSTLTAGPSSWRLDTGVFRRGHADAVEAPLKKKTAAFYRQQSALIDAYLLAHARLTGRDNDAAKGRRSVAAQPADSAAVALSIDGSSGAAAEAVPAAPAPAVVGAGGKPADPAPEPSAEHAAAVARAINLTFGVNVLLFVIKVFAAAYSGSLAVVGSALDSSMDLLSGAIIFVASWIAARRDPYLYPAGKSRLEPLSIIVFACVMGMAALQLIVESAQSVIQAVEHGPETLRIDAVALSVLSAAVLLKAGLFAWCWSLRANPSIEALMQDSRNDIAVNIVSLIAVCLVASFQSVWWLDPATASALALLIVVNWGATAKDYILQLSGRAADPATLSQLVYIAANHDSRITYVDTVRAYHLGTNLLVEVDIVLPESTPLRISHDIGESLQHEYEALPFVDRAFVHMDYEWKDHRADDEHAPV